MKNTHRINGLIYITSEEYIKTGYYLDLNYKIVMKSVFYTSCNKNCKKIILTNDPALTSDGIQAIEPDAVKWLNENPSCEWVRVLHLCEKITCNNNGCHDFCQEPQYKIRLPKPINQTIEDRSYHPISLNEVSETETIEEAAETYTEQQVFNLILLSSNMRFNSIDEVKIWITKNKQQC